MPLTAVPSPLLAGAWWLPVAPRRDAHGLRFAWLVTTVWGPPPSWN